MRSVSCRSTSVRSAASASATVVPSGTGQAPCLFICSGSSKRMQRIMLSWPKVSGPEPLLPPS